MLDASPALSIARATPRRHAARVGLVLMPLTFSVSIAGCGPAHRPAAGTDAVVPGGLCIDGMFIRPGQNDLRQVLEWRFPASLPTWYAPGSPGPLVLVDGIPVDGVQRLGALPATTVASVETLDGFRAVPEYGTRARDGAIVVVTREGLTAGAAAQAHARPVTPCTGSEEAEIVLR